MKEIRTVVEVEGEGLEALLGKNVLLMCACYFYTGVLVGVNEKFVKLDNPKIVYETGAWTAASWNDAQPLGEEPHYVMVQSIESFREVSK